MRRPREDLLAVLQLVSRVSRTSERDGALWSDLGAVRLNERSGRAGRR